MVMIRIVGVRAKVMLALIGSGLRKIAPVMYVCPLWMENNTKHYLFMSWESLGLLQSPTCSVSWLDVVKGN